MRKLKIPISIALLFLVLLITSVVTQNILSGSSTNLLNKLQSLEINTSNQNWPKAISDIEKIQDSWPKMSNSWAMLIEHMEIDNIETSLERVSRYVETKNTSMALAEIEVLKKYISHIPEKESLKIENIL